MTKVKIAKDTVYQYFLLTVWQDSMWHVHVEKHLSIMRIMMVLA